MAVTAYTGVPGAGKSYAMVSQVIVPGVAAGRRVITNIDGVNPEAIYAYCLDRNPDCEPGEVVLFKGEDALGDGFFPTAEKSDEATTVKGGDLVVFDEWKSYWPRRGKTPNPDLELFLRYHRHLVGPDGRACDVVIGTQLVADIHQDFRGLVERSFKFRKLKALGSIGEKSFTWDAYEGHLQAKGESYNSSTQRYRPEIFALYSSYSATGEVVEAVVDKRTSIFKNSLYLLVAAVLGLFIFGAVFSYRFFTHAGAAKVSASALAPGGSAAAVGATGAAARPAKSAFRIVGTVLGDDGVRVIVSDETGSVRMLKPDRFNFDLGRPVSGVVDGESVIAEDRMVVTNQGLQL